MPSEGSRWVSRGAKLPSAIMSEKARETWKERSCCHQPWILNFQGKLGYARSVSPLPVTSQCLNFGDSSQHRHQYNNAVFHKPSCKVCSRHPGYGKRLPASMISMTGTQLVEASFQHCFKDYAWLWHCSLAEMPIHLPFLSLHAHSFVGAHVVKADHSISLWIGVPNVPWFLYKVGVLPTVPYY